jgi:hypothetical protein
VRLWPAPRVRWQACASELVPVLLGGVALTGSSDSMLVLQG